MSNEKATAMVRERFADYLERHDLMVWVTWDRDTMEWLANFSSRTRFQRRSGLGFRYGVSGTGKTPFDAALQVVNGPTIWPTAEQIAAEEEK